MNKTGTQRLETHRLILRRYRMEDAEDMFSNWASDPEVTRFLTWPAHRSVDVTRHVLNDWIPKYEDGGFFNWAMEWKETGQVIGNISVTVLHEETEAAELGYCMSRAFWGRGIMPEAIRAVMDYLFDTVGLNRIEAAHDVNNPKSGRAMEKAGLKLEGIHRGYGRNNLGICDVVIRALTKGEREQKPAREKAPVTVRLVREEDLERVNELRRQVNDLHVQGRSETFRSGFNDALRDHIYTMWNDPEQEIVVAEQDGKVCGFAGLKHISKPENPYMFAQDFLEIHEFGVDKNSRRQGAASEMVRFIRTWAKERGFSRIELNMWSFNRGALAFYEAAGFKTYRRYMEIRL